MIDVISFTDEKDKKLGTYFQDSKNSLINTPVRDKKLFIKKLVVS